MRPFAILAAMSVALAAPSVVHADEACAQPAVVSALERHLFKDMRRLDASLRRIALADLKYGSQFLDMKRTGDVEGGATCEARFGFAYQDPGSGQLIETPGRVAYTIEAWPKGMVAKGSGAGGTGDNGSAGGKAHGLVTTANGDVLILRAPVTRVTATFTYG